MTKRNNRNVMRAAILICAVLMSLHLEFVPGALAQDCMEIANSPLMAESQQSSANIFFLIDDSGSMDWEFLVTVPGVTANNGRWINGSRTVSYLYGSEDDNYDPNDSNGYILGDGANNDSRAKWRTTFSDVNLLYYNPKVYYEPWVTHTGAPMPNANPDRPRTRPITSNTTDPRFFSTDPLYYKNLDDTWITVGGGNYLGIIVDNSAQNNGYSGSGWSQMVSPHAQYKGIYGADLRRTVTAGSSASWSWNTSNSQAGSYHVEVWIPCLFDPTNVAFADTSVRYTINHAGGTYTTTINQLAACNPANPGTWVRLTTTPLSFTNQSGGSVTLTRTSTDNNMRTMADAVRFITPTDAATEAAAFANVITVPISHYYTWNDANNSGRYDAGEDVYLVILKQDNTATYYQVNPVPVDGIITRANLTEVSESAVQASCPSCLATAFRTMDGYEGPATLTARQNFANWYQYYRRRWMTSVYAVSKAINKFNRVNIGLGGINALVQNFPEGTGLVKKLTPVGSGGAADSSRLELLTELFQYRIDANYASTPLRQGYEQAGDYFHTQRQCAKCTVAGRLGTEEPISGDGGKCGLNFIIAFTDGYYDGRAAGTGNVDENQVWATTGEQISGCLPFESSSTGDFADLVMRYYAYDIAPNIDDNVPADRDGIPPDYVTWQHLVTYIVAFGVEGTLNPNDYVLYGTTTRYPLWPPTINTDPEAVDDLFHAAVNGRGEFFSAKNPKDLIEAFNKIADKINRKIGAGARATSNMSQLVSGAMLFRVGYNGTGWSGTLTAQNLNTSGGLLGSNLWSAHTLLNTLVETDGHSARNIATYNGTTGVAFDWNNLGAYQSQLMYQAVEDAGRTGTDLVNYLRGDKTYEVRNGGIFRNRMTSLSQGAPVTTPFTLSDIVHSSATYESETNMVYVGANDGFLHAFDGYTGEERFAYAPSFVIPNMKLLSQPSYRHKFFVDETPVIRKAGDVRLLVAGLGKGGKGLYCLDITDPAANTQANANAWVKWEFPNTQTAASDVADVGYTFGQPYIVKTQRTSQPWVVIFNNGYASPSQKAVLFVLDAFTGEVVKKFDTGIAGCNGLSSLIATDPNANNIADYVYAGDLKGNMWKFDLTDEDPNNWDVAYKNGSTPAPLFTTSDPSGNPQPITAKPDVMPHCDASKPGYIVVFGTGKFLGIDDIGNGAVATQQQTIYGVWDFGDDDDDDEFLGTFNRGSSTVSNRSGLKMVDQTIGDVTGSYDCPDSPICWATVDDTDLDQNDDPNTDPTNCPPNSNPVAATAGWFMDLGEDPRMAGERVVFDVMIIEGSAYVLSLAPDVSGRLCSEGGRSGVYIINACDGGCQLPAEEETTSGTSTTDRYDYDSDYDVVNRDGSTMTHTGGTGGTGTGGTGTGGTGTGGTGTGGTGGTSGAPHVTIGNAGVGGTVLFNPATGQYLYIVTEAGGGISNPVPSEAQKIGLIYWRVVD